MHVKRVYDELSAFHPSPERRMHTRRCDSNSLEEARSIGTKEPVAEKGRSAEQAGIGCQLNAAR